MLSFNLKKYLALVALVCVAATSMAQDNNRDRGGDRGGDRGRFDPAQFQERMMERYREQLEVKDDTEWKALQPLIKKVTDVRMSQMMTMGRGMRRGPEGGNNDSARPANPEMDQLNRAIEGKASASELKTALTKVQEARKAKQAELEKAQAALRQVLSVRQEAVATANGLL